MKVKKFFNLFKRKKTSKSKQYIYKESIKKSKLDKKEEAQKLDSFMLNLGKDDSSIRYKKEDPQGKTMLMHAIEEENIEEVKKILNSGIDINEKDNEGKTHLMYAIEQNNDKIFKMVLCKVRNINEKDNNGKHALIYAVNTGNDRYVEKLLQKRANINQRDKNNRTALIHATKKGQIELIKLLIEKGADVNLLDNYKKNALMYAIRHTDKTEEIVRELLKAKNLRYVTEAVHLVNMKVFYGIGHCGILLVSNTGDGMLYSYGLEEREPNTKKEVVKNEFDDFKAVFNAPFKGKLWKEYIDKAEATLVKTVDKEELDEISKEKEDEIFDYIYRIRMKIDDKDPVKVAIRGARMQARLEDLYREPGLYRLYTKSCATIADDILKEGGFNSPKSLFPKRSHILKRNLVNDKVNWTCPGDYKLILSRLT